MNPIQAAIAMLDRKGQREYHRDYAKAIMRDGHVMKKVELPEDILAEGKVIGGWNSWKYSATAWVEEGIVCRLSINRRELNPDGSWKEGIEWTELQKIKKECGYGEYTAVEVFPPESQVVNVANMRHLWVLQGALPFSLFQE